MDEVRLPVSDARPIACSLEAADVPDRVDAWRALLTEAIDRSAIDGGVRVRFPAGQELAARVAALAVAEQTCCSFFDFRLRIGSDALELEVRAPADAAPVVDALFG